MNRYIERINNGETPEAVLKDVFTLAENTITDCLISNINCPLLEEMQAILEIVEITDGPSTDPIVFVDAETPDTSDDWDDGDLS